MRLIAAAVAVLAIVACGGSDDAASDGPRLTPTAQVPAAAFELATPAPAPTATATPEPDPWADPPVAAQDAAGLAQQIVAAERAVLDPDVTGEELAWMAHLQQVAYRTLVENPRWLDEVVAALPEDVRPAALRNIEGGMELRALISPGDELPSWRIVEPAPLEELLAYYREAEAEFGVPWAYLAAIHLTETFMGRIRGTSVAGAQGPMQFMPATWAAYGEGDINDNRDAIRAAARYLTANGAPGDMATALFRYNPSQHYVRSVTAYAQNMLAVPETFRGYYHWQVYYLTEDIDAHLPVGFGE